MRSNRLYLIAFSAALASCGSVPNKPAPVVDATERGTRSNAGELGTRSATESSAARPDPARASRGTEALLQTLLALDIDYRNGGSSPALGFDCSGLVAHVYREAYGIKLPRETRAQSEVGTPVGLNELQPGDLVFYNTLDRPFSHVGIYLGDNRFVHAPKTGARVRFENVRAGYWVQRFNGARRIASI